MILSAAFTPIKRVTLSDTTPNNLPPLPRKPKKGIKIHCRHQICPNHFHFSITFFFFFLFRLLRLLFHFWGEKGEEKNGPGATPEAKADWAVVLPRPLPVT
jgi:hypothetical protein